MCIHGNYSMVKVSAWFSGDGKKKPFQNSFLETGLNLHFMYHQV